MRRLRLASKRSRRNSAVESDGGRPTHRSHTHTHTCRRAPSTAHNPPNLRVRIASPPPILQGGEHVETWNKWQRASAQTQKLPTTDWRHVWSVIQRSTSLELGTTLITRTQAFTLRLTPNSVKHAATVKQNKAVPAAGPHACHHRLLRSRMGVGQHMQGRTPPELRATRATTARKPGKPRSSTAESFVGRAVPTSGRTRLEERRDQCIPRAREG